MCNIYVNKKFTFSFQEIKSLNIFNDFIKHPFVAKDGISSQVFKVSEPEKTFIIIRLKASGIIL